jgi:hypothetical protein
VPLSYGLRAAALIAKFAPPIDQADVAIMSSISAGSRPPWRDGCGDGITKIDTRGGNV